MSDLKLQWESDIAERSRENVARDVELNTLRDTDFKLRAELSERKHDIERSTVLFHLLLLTVVSLTVVSLTVVYFLLTKLLPN